MANLAFLPDAVAGVIQNGILERRVLKSLRPALLWRMLAQKERHAGSIGETVTKTRSGLITPDDESSALLTAGGEPASALRTIEQFSYSIKPYGKQLAIHLPSAYLAIENKFLDDMDALAFHAAQTIGRIARNALLSAYEGGDTFTTNDPGAVTSVAVQDLRGFSHVMVNGLPTPVSVTNPLAVTIGGTSRLVTAVSGTSGAGTLTISVALDYAQYDRVLRADAPTIVRQNSRATDRLLVAGDTPTIATFRRAAAVMRANNVPGVDGSPTGPYACFIGPHVKDALFADAEFHDAITAVGLTGPFAEGALGKYANIIFIEQPQSEMPVIANAGNYQTDIHRSLMFGAEPLVEGYIPETEFQRMASPEMVASQNHMKMPLDPEGVLTMTVRAPLDVLGRTVTAAWSANVDYCVPSDVNNGTSTARVKRCCVIKTAGPAV